MPTIPLIAIVDDDADIPVAISSLVRSIGYEAKCFTSAQQLLSSPDVQKFSCVVSDIHMPVMNGLQLTRELSTLVSGLPVILMTGRLEPGLEEKAYAHGAASFLAKPFTFNQLSDRLRQALASRS